MAYDPHPDSDCGDHGIPREEKVRFRIPRRIDRRNQVLHVGKLIRGPLDFLSVHPIPIERISKALGHPPLPEPRGAQIWLREIAERGVVDSPAGTAAIAQVFSALWTLWPDAEWFPLASQWQWYSGFQQARAGLGARFKGEKVLYRVTFPKQHIETAAGRLRLAPTNRELAKVNFLYAEVEVSLRDRRDRMRKEGTAILEEGIAVFLGRLAAGPLQLHYDLEQRISGGGPVLSVSTARTVPPDPVVLAKLQLDSEGHYLGRRPPQRT